MNANGDSKVDVGAVLSGHGSFQDQDSTTWLGWVEFGDGSNASFPFDNRHFAFSHQYETPGEYTVTVYISDNSGAVGTDSFDVTVEGAAGPIVMAGVPTTSPDAASGVVFSDTRLARWKPGTTTEIYPSPALWCVSADYDGNGKRDLYVNFGGTTGIWVLLDTGAWQFIKVVDASSSATAADINADGRDELIVSTNQAGAAGTWAYYPNGAIWSGLASWQAESFAVGDFDGNGKQDVAADFGANGLWYYNNGTTWNYIHNFNPAWIAAGDSDANGKSDLYASFANDIWARKDTGTWVYLQTMSTTTAVAADANDDGFDELFVSSNQPGATGIWEYCPGLTTWTCRSGWQAQSFAMTQIDPGTNPPTPQKLDIAADFGTGPNGESRGLWLWKNDAVWSAAGIGDPTMIAGNFISLPLSLAQVPVNENTTGATIGALNANRPSVSYSLVNDPAHYPDNGSFIIESGQLKLRANASLDYEAGPYEVRVLAAYTTDNVTYNFYRTFAIRPVDVNEAPQVDSGPFAAPNLVTGTTTTLSVLGKDQDVGDAAELVYFWEKTAGPASVTFTPNSSKEAKNTVAAFTQAGNYTFQVTITDPDQASVTSTISVTVNQTFANASMTILPSPAIVYTDATQQFTASGKDQFNHDMAPPNLVWSATDHGSINAAGLFTPSANPGSSTVQAQSGLSIATASVDVKYRPPTVTLSGDVSVNDADYYWLRLTVDSADPAAAWTVNWGDSTTTTGTSAVDTWIYHQYAHSTTEASRTCQITASATDTTGGSGSANPINLTVRDTAPEVTITGPSVIYTRSVLTLNLGASDPNGDAINCWSVNWGDGSASSGVGTPPASVSHTYNYNVTGDRTVVASATDVWNRQGVSDNLVVRATDRASPVNTTTSCVPSANPIFRGQSVTLTATVSDDPNGPIPQGTAIFFNNGVTLGTTTLDASGTASLTVPGLLVGEANLVVYYDPGSDPNFAFSSSSAQSLEVKAAPTSVSLTSTTPQQLGDSITLTATVTTSATGLGTPSGSVDFFDTGISLGTATLNAQGVATLVISSAPAGEHSYRVAYSGNSNLSDSVSAAKVVGMPVDDLIVFTDSSIDEMGVAVLNGFLTPATLPSHGTIIWGDGTTSPLSVPAGAKSFGAWHEYEDNGNYVVTVALSGAAATSSIVVNNVAPRCGFDMSPGIDILNGGTMVPGTTYTFTAEAWDICPKDTFDYQWVFRAVGGNVAKTGQVVDFTLAPGQSPPYDLVLKVTDKDGDEAELTASIGFTFPLPDDDRPLVTIEAMDPDGVEAGQPARFRVTSSVAAGSGGLDVQYRAVNGTACMGEDYDPCYVSMESYGLVTIPAGETQAVFEIPTSADTGDLLTPEYFDLVLCQTMSAIAGMPRSARAKINQPINSGPAPTGNLTIYSGKAHDVAISELAEDTSGGYVFHEQSVPMTLNAYGGEAGDQLRLVYDNTKIQIKRADGQVIDATPFSWTSSLNVTITGIEASGALADVTIWLNRVTSTEDEVLDTVKMTVVDAHLEAIKFISNYRVPAEGNSSLLVNGVRDASNFGSIGVQASEWDWEWDTPNVSQPIAQTRNTWVSATVVMKVLPAGVPYSLSSWSVDVDLCELSYLNFRSRRVVSGNGSDSLCLTGGKLCQKIARLEQTAFWTVTNTADEAELDLGNTTHEIFVTYAGPITEFSYSGANTVTDVRIRNCVTVCQGATDQHQAAKKIQEWLRYAKDWEVGNRPETPNGLWGLLDPGGKGQCMESGKIHELMLRLLGIQSIFRLVLATEPGYQNPRNIRVGDAKNTPTFFGLSEPAPSDTSKQYVLYFNFNNVANVGEGGVRVDDRFYTEGSKDESLVVGVDDAVADAEWRALQELATKFNGGNIDQFQRWALCLKTKKGKDGEFFNPDENFKTEAMLYLPFRRIPSP